MPSGSSQSHSTPSRIRTRTPSRVLCSPDVGSGSRPACSSASSWKAVNHASTSSASSSVAGRSTPAGAGGTSTDVASQSRVRLVRDHLAAGQLGGRPGEHLGAGQRAVGAAEELPALVQRARERAGGVVGHRHREGRVGLERRGPHRRTHHGARPVAHDEPPPGERSVDLGPRVPAVGQLASGPLGHARDDAAQDGVRGEQVTGRVEERLRGVEELQGDITIHPSTLGPDRATSILVFAGRRPVNRLRT